MLSLAVAFAQEVETPDVNAQLYRPPIDARTTLWTEDARLGPTRTGTARVVASYVHRPLVVELPEGEAVELVAHVLQTDLVAGYVIGPVRLGAGIPIYARSWGDQGAESGLGDVALDIKAALVDASVGFAIGSRLLLPTATVDLPLGSRGLGWEGFVMVDHQVGRLSLAANLGTRALPKAELNNVTVNDQLFFRIGEGYALTDATGISLDVGGQFNYSASLGNSAGVSAEALLGGWHRFAHDWVLRGGVGTGIARGIGSPTLRAVLGVGWEPEPKDRDEDGIVDRADMCPDDREDRDGFEDQNGCPDTDNDGDYILDDSDACPDDPEDDDGVEDEDGCPDARTVVVLRFQDPNGGPVAGVQAEVEGDSLPATGASEFHTALEPGIYDLDATAEGYAPLDAKFQVSEPGPVEVVETMTPVIPMGSLVIAVYDGEGKLVPGASWQLDHGRPAPVPDGATAVPPGEYVVTIRAEGYATAYAPADVFDSETSRLQFTLVPSRVEVVGERISLEEKIYFDTGKDKIKAESLPLLDEVASVLGDHPEIELVRVEGHTDSRGSDASNLDLSERRAFSVRRYLITQGVEPWRLQSVGFGESRPLDPEETEAAWEKNRRVDIFIVKRSDD
jgi:outer membrane protein OmpA-like peptidoglycan-associated protein